MSEARASGAMDEPSPRSDDPRGFTLRALVVVAAFVALAASFAYFMSTRSRPAPTAYFDIGSFRLISERGSPYGSADLSGRIYVVDFVFTLCMSSCPILSARMADVQSRTARHGSRVQLVSISVDPANDTPERLATYARRFGARPDRWTFLTGPREAVFGVIERNFRVAFQDAPRMADGGFDPNLLLHVNRFILVDRRGRMRGSYDPTDPATLDRLVSDVDYLAERD